MTRGIPPFLVGFMLAGLMGCAELPPTPDPVVLPVGSIPCFEPKPVFRVDPLDCSEANALVLRLLDEHDEAVASQLDVRRQYAQAHPGDIQKYDSGSWVHFVEALFVGWHCWQQLQKPLAQRLQETYSLEKRKLGLRSQWYDCSSEWRTLDNYKNFTLWSK